MTTNEKKDTGNKEFKNSVGKESKLIGGRQKIVAGLLQKW